MSDSFLWTCNFCSMAQTVSSNFSVEKIQIRNNGSKHKFTGAVITSVSCSNDSCKELTIIVSFNRATMHSSGQIFVSDEEIEVIGQRPSSLRLIQPNYIPAPIVQDYYEACDILKLSPKASATLSRRCLQGVIRDFCGISKPRLIEEIKELKKRIGSSTAPQGVTGDIVDAIDAVREIGNIGAHMEADINVIIDVDPNEARSLLSLVELLFKEWYVARHDRQQRISAVLGIANEKAALKPPREPKAVQ